MLSAHDSRHFSSGKFLYIIQLSLLLLINLLFLKSPLVAQNKKAVPSPEEAEMLTRLASLYEATADYHRTWVQYECAFEFRKKPAGSNQEGEGQEGAVESVERARAQEFYNAAIEAYSHDEYDRVLSLATQGLEIDERINSAVGMAWGLNLLGNVYYKRGDYDRARVYYKKGFDVAESANYRIGMGHNLSSLGSSYYRQGNYGLAQDYYERSLQVRREINDKDQIARALNDLANVSQQLGNYAGSLELRQEALKLWQQTGNKGGIADALNDIGWVYDDLGDHIKSLEYLQRSVVINREINQRWGVADGVDSIGLNYLKLGRYRNALKCFREANVLFRRLGNRDEDARTLNHIGEAFYRLHNYREAGVAFEQSLVIAREIKAILGEGETLGNLMSLSKFLNKPRLAIFYGKQAINAYQVIRSNIQNLEKALQGSFLHTKEDTYRTLADLLISEGRLPEAQQILGLLKEEEYFEFVRRDPTVSSLTARAALTRDEAKLEEEYRKLADQVTLMGKQRGELFNKQERTDEEERLLSRLDEQLSTATEHFQKFLEQLQVRLGQNTAKGARVIEVKDALGMKKTLRELGPGAVLLYTLVGADKYRIMLVTPDSEQAYENPINAVALQRKVLAFRVALQDPDTNPAPLAQELYRILIGPKLAQDLKQAGATTLMWSLDGVLRYLPIVALNDGQKYLVETYRNVIFTPASRDRLKDPVSEHWKGLGLGVSKAKPPYFEALPGAEKELHSIIRDTSAGPTIANRNDGVLAGRVILDESFTKEAMKAALRQRYQLVHIASHFVFQPGNETSSFLLLGDSDPRNDRLTLEEVKKVSFEGVDLLTLSACETALGGKQANGVEVESFGVLAQRQGAAAVLATLWSVADESTSQLMREFYRIRETTPGITKAEALQRAQLALLSGKLQDQSRAAKDTNTNWRHPYYWAPFILIGNWR